MTSISGPATDRSADSSISAPNVIDQGIPKGNATHTIPPTLSPDQIQQQVILLGHNCQPVTPINSTTLGKLLTDHPNRHKVEYVVNGFQFGFSLKYTGPRVNRQPKNLLSAYQNAPKLWASLIKETQLGRMLCPFPVQPLNPFICSPVGMVPKKDSQEMRRITHLSHPQGQSVNSFIDPQDTKTNYQTFDTAIELVAKAGPGSFMAKEDFKSAFHNVPITPADWNLLGIKVQGQFFIDICLPFGAAISCAIFEDISTLIHWIVQRRAGHALIHYLDDFFTVHPLKGVCKRIMDNFRDVCSEIGMPVAQEKSAGPVQVIQFLGLTIDTTRMVILIPQDKRADISRCIEALLKKKKATSLQLQSLAGKLNFICKAVPAGRPFIANVYRAFQGIPQHHHVQLRGEILTDLRMWCIFIQTFRGWQQIISSEIKEAAALELYADTSGNPQLGWGAYLPTQGLWMFQQWDTQWFQEFQPSIDFLELYALLAGLVTWAQHFIDKTIIFRSDNTPTVYALTNKSSSSRQMLKLLRYLTFFCMINNITIKALHISGKKNIICDLLSRLKLQAFHNTKPGNTKESPLPPDTRISPISEFMQKNLFE